MSDPEDGEELSANESCTLHKRSKVLPLNSKRLPFAKDRMSDDASGERTRGSAPTAVNLSQWGKSQGMFKLL